MASASVAASSTDPFPAKPYTPRFDSWPYDDSDFRRYDENDDGIFYRQPRFVTHIDDPSIARLTEYYDTVLPMTGNILDMCTSWKSFYPTRVDTAARAGEVQVYGVGLNAQEMEANKIFGDDGTRWKVLDLNKEPHDIREAWKDKKLMFDAVTCVVSIDYLFKPLDILRNVRNATTEGGKIHLIISNRCFPNKVVRKWLMLSEQSRLEFVGNYLQFSGWKDIEIVDVCARDESGMRTTDDHGTVLIRSPHLPDHLDPLWVVRATQKTKIS